MIASLFALLLATASLVTGASLSYTASHHTIGAITAFDATPVPTATPTLRLEPVPNAVTADATPAPPKPGPVPIPDLSVGGNRHR